MSAGTILRGSDRLARLAAARQWRIDNKPYFDAIYGPETETHRCPTYTLDRQIAEARRNMGEERWAELNKEWEQ